MTDCASLIRDYLSGIEALFRCARLENDRAIISTPYSYLDGDTVEFIAQVRGDRLHLTDFGGALGRISLLGTNVESDSVRRRLDLVLRSFRVDLLEESLRVEGPVSQTADLMLRLMGAMREVDSLSLLQPEPRAPRFERRVLSRLRSLTRSVEEHPTLLGRSGTSYRLTARVFPDHRDTGSTSTYVQAVSGGRGESGIRSVNFAYRAFSDVDGQLRESQKLVVLSAQSNGWRSEDITLLGSVAYVGAWWEPELLERFLLQGDLPDDRRLFTHQTQISE